MEKELLNKSHILPNFMYKGIEDEKNRMYVISSSKPHTEKIVQSGAYENFIFCQNCDNVILGKLERYANNHFFSQINQQDNLNFKNETINEVEVIRCNSLRYSDFKLFLSSLIWRASISSLVLFNGFKLEKEEDEKLRLSILNNSPLSENEFSCTIITPINIEDVKTDIVFVNTTRKNNVSFIINQFAYLFHLENNMIDPAIKTTHLSLENRMTVLKVNTVDWTKLRESAIEGVANEAKKNIKR